MNLNILNSKGEAGGAVEFDENLLTTKASAVILHEVVTAYRANQRAGTHATKTRGEVSGGGKKPWRQKGTGRARAGSIRSPLWRKGGTMFGPEPRDYSQALPKKKLKAAFKLALKGLMDEGRLQVVEPPQLEEAKTKHVAAIYKKWNVASESLFVVDKLDANWNRAARNINAVEIVNVQSLNTYDCLKARKVFITKDALGKLADRLKGAAAPVEN